jgi:hypothetical protein
MAKKRVKRMKKIVVKSAISASVKVAVLFTLFVVFGSLLFGY